ncbi:MAG: PAS domain S-box protein [Promethearchaeota archaeon]
MMSIYQEYNNHLDEIFANSFDYIYLHDKAGNVIDVNDVVINNLGYSKQEILNMKVRDFLFEDNVAEILSEIKNTIKTGLVKKPKIYKVKKKNGNFVYIEANAIPIKKNGEIYAILGIGHDITKYKEMEDKLKISEEKYRNIVENTTDVIIVTRFDGKHLYISPQYMQLLGYSEQEADKVNFELIHPDDRPKIMNLYRKSVEEKQTLVAEIEQRWKHKDGHYIWVATKSKNYYNKGGEVIGWITSIRDITERKKAELKLIESEEKFRTLAEQSFMGIIIIQGGKLKYMNKTLSEISGYPVEVMLKWSEKEITKMIHPEDLNQMLNRIRSNKEENMATFSINSFRIINRDGEVRWLEDYTSRIIYQGKLANLVSLIDVTDKREANRLIFEENKRLLELSELRKDLIIRVSHELKTPMTSIYGAIQILNKLFLDEIGAEAKNYIEICHRGCLRLKELIDNLLDVSRLDAKRFQLNLQRENLKEIIMDCAYDMKYLTTNRNLKLKLNFLKDIFYNVDKLRIRQVLTNLISNAIKNTPKGGDISINLAETPELIEICVKDTGIGITKKEQENLFEKFGKIERYGKNLDVDIEGSGLGLYISKEIVELHGGQILVESEGRNKGSNFKVRFFKKMTNRT